MEEQSRTRRRWGGPTGRRGLRRTLLTATAGAVAVLTALSMAAAPAQAAPLPAGTSGPLAGLVSDFSCATVTAANSAHCLGKIRVVRASNGKLAPMVTSGPTGYGPPDIQSAYKLTGMSATGTVAVVDAFDDPNLEADLGKYRSQYGLPACTSATGCFTKESQTGSTTALPTADAGWGVEESLDVDMISATCPTCHILIVEANSANDTDLEAAEDTAATAPGVVAVSNSYGESEPSTAAAGDAHYNHPGVAITVSSGDSGYGVEWPASSPYVTAVGGTSLSKASNTRGWTETAWSDAGSGCSSYAAKPSWQTDAGCARRTVADVSAVADPNTGLAVYDTYNTCGTSSLCDVLISLGLVAGADGWVQVGGTSASSPIIASVYALAGNTGSVNYGSYPYGHTSALNDVTSGSNGSCSGSYLCTAGAGYDGPTGLGTPNGTGAF